LISPIRQKKGGRGKTYGVSRRKKTGKTVGAGQYVRKDPEVKRSYGKGKKKGVGHRGSTELKEGLMWRSQEKKNTFLPAANGVKRGRKERGSSNVSPIKQAIKGKKVAERRSSNHTARLGVPIPS